MLKFLETRYIQNVSWKIIEKEKHIYQGSFDIGQIFNHKAQGDKEFGLGSLDIQNHIQFKVLRSCIFS